MGRDAAREVDRSLGLYADGALQDYVGRVGARLVAVAERPGLPWAFHVIDDPAVNAFALPGGFVYVTRGLMTHLTSEAELGAVLGHEIGHVTARHSVSRESKAELAQIGLLAGAILRPELADLSGLAQSGLGLLFLKYSRDDESQADELGLRYMSRAGYDPREMPRVFSMLDRVERQQAGSKVPNWLSTHPAPANRVRLLTARVDAGIETLGGDLDRREVGRDAYLHAIDGLVFGDDPRQGYFQGSLFVQPQLGVQLRFPEGWKTANERTSVTGTSPEKDAAIALTLASEGSAEAAARQFFGQSGIEEGEAVELGGALPLVASSFSASTSDAGLRGVAAFAESGGKVYRLLGFATAARWSARSALVTRALATFSRVADRAALEVQPKHIEVVRLPRAMTLEDFYAQYPSTIDFATLSIVDQVDPGAVIPAGTAVKRVVGPEPPA